MFHPGRLSPKPFQTGPRAVVSTVRALPPQMSTGMDILQLVAEGDSVEGPKAFGVVDPVAYAIFFLLALISGSTVWLAIGQEKPKDDVNRCFGNGCRDVKKELSNLNGTLLTLLILLVCK
eukprot:6185369-Pleurochrysis_carterae.AAC.2